MLAGLNEISGGGIILAGKELVGPGPDRGIVFQSPCLLPWLTAFENVMIGVDQVFFTATKEERRQIAEYYLTVVGLGDAMQARQTFARHETARGHCPRLALKPKMLLLDEPFGMLIPHALSCNKCLSISGLAGLPLQVRDVDENCSSPPHRHDDERPGG
jgi:ABC-type taurine transport system ATPase subunit